MSAAAIAADAAALATDRFGLEVDAEQGPWVPPEHVRELARALKNELGFRFFVYCAAEHHLASPGNEAKGVPDEPAVLHVHYRVRRLGPGSSSFPFRVRVPVDVSVPSLTEIYAGADWQEREQYDLVGVVFEGHPDLRRLMMPEDWEGHPLRRDYAIDTRHHPWR